MRLLNFLTHCVWGTLSKRHHKEVLSYFSDAPILISKARYLFKVKDFSTNSLLVKPRLPFHQTWSVKNKWVASKAQYRLLTAFYFLVVWFDWIELNERSESRKLDARAQWETWRCRGLGPRNIFFVRLLPQSRVLRVFFRVRWKTETLWIV